MQTPARYKTDGFPGPRAKIFLNIVQQLHEILFLYLVFSLKYRRNTSDSIQIRFAPASSFHPLVGSIPFWSLLSGWWSLKSAYIKFLWWLLTFSLCFSTPKTSQQQTGTAESSLASRWPCPSASVTLLEDDVMVIAMTSSTLREKKKSPTHLKPRQGTGETKVCARQGRCQLPSSAQPLYLPWLRIKPSASTCYVEVVIAFLQLHGTRQHRFTEWLGLKGTSGGRLVQKWLSSLVQILFMLLHQL